MQVEEEGYAKPRPDYPFADRRTNGAGEFTAASRVRKVKNRPFTVRANPDLTGVF